MSEEPIFIRQTTDPAHCGDPLSWCRDSAKEGRENGADFFRASARRKRGDANCITCLLIEGWKEMPADQGEPRWDRALTTQRGTLREGPV